MILGNLLKKQSIQMWMLMQMEEMLKHSQEVVSTSLLPYPNQRDYYDPEAPTEIQELISMGFKNSLEVRNYQEELEKRKRLYQEEYDKVTKHNNSITSIHKEVEMMKERLKFLLQARKVYGNDTILIPFEAFQKLLKKYKLVCGEFENFIGDIPKDRIQSLKELLSIRDHPRGVIEVYPVDSIEYRETTSSDYYKAKRKLKRIPFLISRKREQISWWRNDDKTHYTFPDGETITQTDRAGQFKINSHFHTTTFFIAAPKKYFKKKIASKRIPSIPKDKDPLVCAFTKYGVLITVRWGEEATDRIIHAFEDFNERLNELGL